MTRRSTRPLRRAVVVTVMLVAALAWRFGALEPLTSGTQVLLSFIERPVTAGIDAAARAAAAITGIPRMAADRDLLRTQNLALTQEIDTLRERLANAPGEHAAEKIVSAHPDGTRADVLGYDPAHVKNQITIDQGSAAGIAVDAGVIDDHGVVGRVVSVTPYSSRVLLLTDYTSAIPAVVQNGRWWGIARGTLTRVQLEYVSLDAVLHTGDRIVTVAAVRFPPVFDRLRRQDRTLRRSTRSKCRNRTRHAS